jgi:type 1 glutamine amidotransferase
MKIPFHSAVYFFVFSFIFFNSIEVNAQDEKANKKAKILYFTRSSSEGHSPARMREDGTTLSGAALKKYCNARNIELVESHDGQIFDSDVSSYNGFVFYTTGGLQDENQKVPTMHPVSDSGIKNLIESVRTGTGLVGIHSATDTHCKVRVDGKDPYVAMMGGRFCGHGPQQYATPIVTEPIELPYLKAMNGKLTAYEEWYAMREYNTDMHIIFAMNTEAEGLDGYEHHHYSRPPFPLSWIRMEGKGRVAYTPFGHDDKYWWNAENVQRVGELIEWSLGRFEMDTTPNLNNVAPNCETMPVKK